MALGIMTAVLCFCEMFRGHSAIAQPLPPPAVASPAAPVLTGLRARGILRVCVWSDAYAFSWRNPRSEQMEGLGIVLAQALALRLGLSLRLVETGVAAFPARLERGECDVAAIGVATTAERAARVAFSRPFLSSPILAVVSRGSTRIRDWADLDRAGVVIAVNEGSAIRRVMQDRLRNAELLPLQAPEQREQEVLAGRADALLSDSLFALRLQRSRDWVRVIVPPPQLDEVFYALAVPRGDPAWLAEVDAFLDAARADGSLARAAGEAGLGAMLLR